METPFATPNDENLPGEAVFGEKIGEFPDSWQVRWLSTTGSTNDDLLEAGRAGAPSRVALVTDYQSAGRGRLDRTWVAPEGANLLVSLLLREVPRFPHALTHAVALAAAAASETVVAAAGGKVKVDVKWPNDLLVDGQKLAGILSAAGPMKQMMTEVESYVVPEFVVVGLGLNVGWAPEDAACLQTFASAEIARDAVLKALLVALDRLLDLTPTQLHERYRTKLSTLRRAVRIELPSGAFVEGRALDVEVDGRLVVLDSCGVTQRLDIGDIVHLRS
jgi:BirA family biotin operon repressor/biotin-[acetyl-CoA-carboxylase] ligase